MRIGPLAALLAALIAPHALAAADDRLLTVAERSGYKATARHAEVVDLCKALAEARPGLIRYEEMGRTGEGRAIPMMIVADPPVATPEEAARSGKLVVLAIGNIHAGEVCGKEALPILARELTDAPGHPLLKDVILIAAPIYNADGNERVRRDNRPGQVGPEEGMGQRANAGGLDLNRDFVKMEAAETRALVRAFNRWDPHLFLDLHTTNGSHHRYLITYQGPLNPGGDGALLKYVRDSMFPGVAALFKAPGGRDSFVYGNFNRDHTKWEMYGAQPRFSTTYAGVRNRIGILSEAYSYAPYKDRVLGTRDFVVACLTYAQAHKAEVAKVLADARAATIAAGRDPKPGDKVAIRSEVRAFPGKVDVLGFVEAEKDGRAVATDEPKTYNVELEADFAPTLAVPRPFAYLIPPKHAAAVEAIRRHGIEVSILREDLALDVEVSRVDAASKSPRPFQKHNEAKVDASTRAEGRVVPAGTVVVRTGQALGSLAVLLLEPASEDGLTTWNFFDDALTVGADFPVLRLPRPATLWTSPPRPLPEDRSAARAAATPPPGGGRRGGRRGGAMGAGTQAPSWIDGDRLLQVRDGKAMVVDPASGRSEPYLNVEARAKALAAIKAPADLAGQLPDVADPSGKGGLHVSNGALIYAAIDGSVARVLVPGGCSEDDIFTFSPDGRRVAFLGGNDLRVVEVDSARVTPLTEGGTDRARNGRADWVYFEELFDRRWKAFWWSPDSSRVAYLRLDDAPVKTHVVLDEGGDARKVEETPYPRSGEPNPLVRLGVVAATGGPTTWADLSAYPADSTIVSHVAWMPDGKTPLAYIQNRTQTFLDICKVSPEDGKVARLLRDETPAWVAVPGDPKFLDDGSFLLTSERDGYKHLYRFGADGALVAQLTRGDWEIGAVHHVDKGPSGFAYVSANREAPMSSNLYRVPTAGGPVERLTMAVGDHRSTMSPGGTLALDTWSDLATPPRTALIAADGKAIRTVDAGPPVDADPSATTVRRRFQIKARDGYPLEAELVTPASIDPSKVYPAWLMTYGGPHTSTVSDGYAGDRQADRALAADGFIVFHMDPRSASPRGAKSTWTAYKQLGVQEARDVEDAVNWLKREPYVDASRIGMSGHSYGGYLTAYCMTHTDLFAAGIAGAPVTDWHDYDSIYTERYMLTPKENPAGYRASSVVEAASKLHGRLLILHGLMDDNVSFRNTARLAAALQRADKDFEMMVYPPSRHGIGGDHYSRLHREFIRRLGGPRDRASGGAASASR